MTHEGDEVKKPEKEYDIMECESLERFQVLYPPCEGGIDLFQEGLPNEEGAFDLARHVADKLGTVAVVIDLQTGTIWDVLPNKPQRRSLRVAKYHRPRRRG